MRYTTVIDISEIPELYRNHTVRLVYLHLVLKSGYHDDDRDIAKLSIRRLAMEADVTVSACRHALHVLEKAGLLTNETGGRRVKKFIEEQAVTKRARTKREMQEQLILLERQKNQAQRDLESREKNDYNPDERLQSEGFKNLSRRFGKGK